MSKLTIFALAIALTTGVGTALAQSGMGGSGSAPGGPPGSTPIALAPMSQPTSVAPGTAIAASPQALVPGVTQVLATQPAMVQPVPSTTQRSLTQPSMTQPWTAPNPPSIAANPPAGAMPVTAAPREAQARAKIEADGYKNVGELTRGPDGMWRGMAMRGSTSVQVTVDARGNVTLQ